MKSEAIYDTIINERLKRILKIQSTVIGATTEYLRQKGFVQLLPVMLSPITDPLGPDPGSSVIKTGTIEYLGQKLQLTQSMILHKQIAIAKGLDKIFILSPNIRLESPSKKETGVHAFEFTQLDFEIAHAKMSDIFSLVEEMLRFVKSKVLSAHLKELEFLERNPFLWNYPFPRYTSHFLEEYYGKKWEEKVSKEAETPFWVICHDREFYDKKEWSRKDGNHFLNYDLYYPEGYGEALSGGEREYEYHLLIRRIEEDQIPHEKLFSYLELAKKGLLRPSAGAGIGIERLVRYFTGAKHIKEVQLFKRIPGEKVVF